MPWPMVHFAIADKVCSGDPCPYFLLGSIAPDAIHAREGTTREDKGRTHFMENGVMPTIDQIGQHAVHYLSSNRMPEWKAFIQGYISHVYTDLRWTETLYAGYEASFHGAAEMRRNTYNREVSQIEFILMRSEAWTECVISKLQEVEAIAMPPLIEADEIEAYSNAKIEWLLHASNEPGITPIYFEEEKVRTFISRTSEELHRLFKEWGISVI
ncbi:zinc dependent phospholipase C family protein [Paenibacillus ferrarius]|uniref:zinc dependent phospholipase C family protein n=1 Tax=Paenibacillus ferrarius TaxID=1469647 RepID=UPI003D2DAE9B